MAINLTKINTYLSLGLTYGLLSLAKFVDKCKKKKTSAQWQLEYPNPKVLDPDGWDRKNFHYSWFEEKITHREYMDRVIESTCRWKFIE